MILQWPANNPRVVFSVKGSGQCSHPLCAGGRRHMLEGEEQTGQINVLFTKHLINSMLEVRQGIGGIPIEI